MRKTKKQIKRRLLYLFLAVAFVVPMITGMFGPVQSATADVSGTGYNLLQLVGEHCHDLHSIEYDFGIPSNVDRGVGQCHAAQPNLHGGDNKKGWEEVLASSLNCSTNMFYKHDFTDPNDPSNVLKSLWYTNLGAYKDCYNKALTMYNNMANPSGQCNLAADGSQNYTNCQADVNNLHDALGCSTDMLTKTGQQSSNGLDYWTVDPSSAPVQDCLQRINDVGKKGIWIIQNGKRVKSDPIGSSSVQATGSGPGSSTGSTGPSISCGTMLNPLNWFLCPITKGFQTIIQTLNDEINNLLYLKTDDIFGTAGQGSSGYEQAWNAVRILSLGLLAVIGLVIIISQALGFEILDAYAVRRALPRLIIAAIVITLSWAILRFAVDLANALGVGVRSLIYAPFSQLSNQQISFGASFVLNLIAGAAMLAMGIVALLSFGLTAVLAVLIAFAVLIVRNMVVIALIIFAPVAIAAYILPNTQRAWRMWLDLFIKTLMMYPIISAMIAIGRVFSVIALNPTGGGQPSFVNQLIAFAAYFLPYFMLPTAFQLGGAAISGANSFLQNRARGSFERLKKQRAATLADRYERAKNEKLWDPENRLNKLLRGNTWASWAASPHKNLAYATRNRRIPILSRTGRRLESSIHSAAVEQSQNLFDTLNKKYGFNDKAYRAISGAHDGLTGKITSGEYAGMTTAQAFQKAGIYGRALSSEEDIHTAASIMGLSDSHTEALASRSLSAGAAEISSTYTDPEKNYSDVAAAGLIGLAAHGFAGGEDLAQVGSEMLNSGRSEGYVNSVLSTAEVIGGQSRFDIKAGYGHAFKRDANGKAVGVIDGMSEEGGRAWDVLGTISSGDIARAKTGALQKMRKTGVLRDAIAFTKDPEAVKANWRRQGISEAVIAKRARVATDKAAMIKNGLFQAAGRYAHGAFDTGAEARSIIHELSGIDPSIEKEFGAYTREETDSATRGEGEDFLGAEEEEEH